MSNMASNGPEAASASTDADPRRHVTFLEPSAARTSTRQRPTHLQPLATGHINPYHRRHSGPYLNYPVSANPMSPTTPNSAVSLATPSLLGVREYYRENGLYTAFQAPSPPTAPPPTPTNPRRHSIVSPTGLASRFDRLQASSPQSAGMSSRSPRRSIVDESRDILLAGINRNELSRLGSIVAETMSGPDRRPSEQPVVTLGKPPPGRLREWGYAYLGNAKTADVFVRAMHIRPTGKDTERRDSVMSNKSEEDDSIVVPQSDEDHFVIRARVFPRSKQRKPFLIQRRFNKADLHRGSPVKAEQTKGEDKCGKSDSGSGKEEGRTEESSDQMPGVEPSHPTSKRTPSPQPTPSLPPKPPGKALPPIVDSKKRVMPIRKFRFLAAEKMIWALATNSSQIWTTLSGTYLSSER